MAMHKINSFIFIRKIELKSKYNTFTLTKNSEKSHITHNNWHIFYINSIKSNYKELHQEQEEKGKSNPIQSQM